MRIAAERFAILVLILQLYFNSSRLEAQTSGWSVPIALNDRNLPTSYPSLAIGKHGELFVAWERQTSTYPSAKAQIMFASKTGQTWSEAIAISDTGRWDWTPDIAVDTLGAVHIVWGEAGTGEIYHIAFDGTDWTQPENISQDSGNSYFPRIAIDRKNKIHVVWHDDSRGDYSIYYRSFDGIEWTAPQVISDSLPYSIYPRIAIGPDDGVHFTFMSRAGSSSTTDVFYRQWRDGGWSPIMRITNDSSQSVYPVVGVTSSNKPFVTWEQAFPNLTGSPIERICWVSYDGSHWSAPGNVDDTSRSMRPSVAVDGADRIHIVWQLWDPSTGKTSILYKHSQKEFWTPALNITGSTTSSSSPIINVDNMNACHVVWVASDNGIYYTTCSSINDIVSQDRTSPEVFVVEQNYPNPFNGRTNIRYSLSQAAQVVVSLYDVLGRVLYSWKGPAQQPGVYTMPLEVPQLPTGAYFYQMRVGSMVKTKKLELIR